MPTLPKQFVLALIIAVVAWADGASAIEQRTIGVISDGEPFGQMVQIEQAFKNEIRALTSGEFEIAFKPFVADWSPASIQEAFRAADADPQVDMVLVLGFAANQLGVGRDSFAKPTFLPLVRDGGLLKAPADGNRSGKPGLNYISNEHQFDQQLSSLRSVVPFRSFSLMIDALVVESAPILEKETIAVAERAGVEARFLLHDGQRHELDSELPDDTEAVIIAYLPRMPPADFDGMIERLTNQGIPTFGLSGGRNSVERGMLASDAVTTDFTRLQRRAALNIQAVLLGERAEDQPIRFDAKRELNINMGVARRLGVSPRFDVMSEAVLVNEEPPAQGQPVSLIDIAALAQERNLDLAAERLGVVAGARDVAIARSNLLPSLSLSSSYLSRDTSTLVQSGQFAERSFDGAVSFGQPVYVDDVWANITIQRQIQVGREQALEQVRLDLIEGVVVAALNVLRAETQLRIFQDNLNLSRTNLDLARDRVRVGSSSAADVYRWEARLATARSEVLAGRARVDQAQEALNRLLHQPLETRIQIKPPATDALFSLSAEEFTGLVDNPRRWELFVDHEVEGGLARAPELAQLDALIEAKSREVTNLRRDFWLPDVVLSGQYSDNFDQSGLGSGPPREGESDWTLLLEASLPLFEGGARRSAVSRADLELQQLRTQRGAIAERIEQAIRANFHDGYARYSNIQLSAEAARASRQNLELVTDAYSRGLVSVIDLLDAQNASLQADEAAQNAVFDFLLTVVATQRVTGHFPFLLPEAQQRAMADALRNLMATIDATEP